MTRTPIFHVLLLCLFGDVISKECYVSEDTRTRRYYNGTYDRTVHGNICQRWDSQTPHSHSRDEGHMFPDDDSVNNASNYCRDPYGSGKLFCYTTNPSISNEPCSVPNCTEPNGNHVVTADTEMMHCRYLPDSGACDNDEEYFCRDSYTILRSELTRRNCEELFCCVRKGCRYGKPHEYNGTWSYSKDGEKCRFWNGYLRTTPDPDNFPEKSLAEAGNYCRDPDMSGFTWCYVDRRIRFGKFAAEPCNIPTCDDYVIPQNYDHDCYEITDRDKVLYGNLVGDSEEKMCEIVTGQMYIEVSNNSFPECKNCTCCQKKGCYNGNPNDYTGTWSMTANGRKCKAWVETSMKNEDLFFPDDTVADAHNYCRHTSNYEDRGLWCYTMDEDMPEDTCDIPHCDDVPPTGSETIPTTTPPDVSTINNQPDEANTTVQGITPTLQESSSVETDNPPATVNDGTTTIQEQSTVMAGATTAGRKTLVELVAVLSVLKCVSLPNL